MTLWLTVEISPGSDIAHACREAIDLATKLGVTIWFDFNGVKCGARPGDDSTLLVNQYHCELKRGSQHKIACANKPTTGLKPKVRPATGRRKT